MDGFENKTQEQWRQELDDSTFQVMRCSATEPAFTGIYWDHHEKGIYRCAGCKTILFNSDTKYDSGTGWPSFDQPVSKDVIEEVPDNSAGMQRTEIRCAKCHGHIGHVFTDGSIETTGLRYCTNSAALQFEGE